MPQAPVGVSADPNKEARPRERCVHSAIQGKEVRLRPKDPYGQALPATSGLRHVVFPTETHNFPTGELSTQEGRTDQEGVGRARSQPPHPGDQQIGCMSLFSSRVVSGGPCSSMAIPLPLSSQGSPFSGATTGTGSRIECPVHGPRGPRGGWHCWLCCFGNFVSQVPSLCSLPRFLLLAGTGHFYLLS